MKYKNCLLTAIISVVSAGAAMAQTVSILEDGKPIKIESEQTQTQISPGWKIVDLQLPSKVQRYLWNPHARDVSISDGRRPKLVVNSDSLLLCDMVLIRLKTKAEYRLIPKPDIHDCKKIFCDLQNFSIEPYEENENENENVNQNENVNVDENQNVDAKKSANANVDAFVVQPLKDLDPGEYVITWFTAPTIGQYRDWKVWPLSIR